MIHVLSGDFFGRQRLAELKSQFGDESLQSLNTTFLDGHEITLAELVTVCDAVPFLAAKRLVVVEGLLGRFTSGKATEGERTPPSAAETKLAEALADYLQRLPPFTELVFVEEKEFNRAHRLFGPLTKAGAEIVQPKRWLGEERQEWLKRWLADRMAAKGGSISTAALREIAAYDDTDLNLLDSELDKLMLYAAGRQIEAKDVQKLGSFAWQGDIFRLVDALGQGNSRSALSALRHLFNRGEAPHHIFAMVIRQFRLLIQAKELQETGQKVEQVASALRTKPFVATKLLRQCQRFTLPQLEGIYWRLLEVDTAVKRGQADPVVALDLLAVETTQPGKGPARQR